MSSSTRLLFTAFSLFSFTTALPQRTALTPTTASSPPKCEFSASEASYSSLCWNQLNVANYLTSWSINTPNCKPSDPVKFACCHVSESWSSCFLRLSTGVGGSDCSKIGSPSCKYNSQLGPNAPSVVAPQMSYVLRNILAISAMFEAYYGGQEEGAIQSTAPAAGTTMGEISDSLDFNGNTSLNVVNVIHALSMGLPFFGTPSLQKESLSNALTLQQVGKTVAQSLQQTPNVSNTVLTATQDPTNQTLSVRYMGQQLSTANIMLRIYNGLNAALGLLMSDIPTFLNFTTSGAWSTPNLITPTLLTNSTPGIALALLTYVTSETLAQNNFSFTLLNPDSLPVPTNASQEPQQNNNNNNNNSTSNTIFPAPDNAALYKSPNTQRSYKLLYTGPTLANGSTPDPYTVLTQIETNNWADLPVLFDGAYNCTLQGMAGGPVVNTGTNASLDMSCLSVLPVYISARAACPVDAVHVGGRCPFNVRA